MKLRPAALALFLAAPVLITIAPPSADELTLPAATTPLGCTPQQLKTVKDIQDAVLKGADLLCLLSGAGANHDTAEAAATACGIVEKLDLILPVIRDLIPVRNAARRSGVVYRAAAVATVDAGAR